MLTSFVRKNLVGLYSRLTAKEQPLHMKSLHFPQTPVHSSEAFKWFFLIFLQSLIIGWYRTSVQISGKCENTKTDSSSGICFQESQRTLILQCEAHMFFTASVLEYGWIKGCVSEAITQRFTRSGISFSCCTSLSGDYYFNLTKVLSLSSITRLNSSSISQVSNTLCI